MTTDRRDYDRSALLDGADVDPLLLLDRWLADAAAEPSIEEPMAMTLATMDDFGPDARIVLLRGRDERGLRFFTNRDSAKGRQLAAVPRAAAVFHWQPLERQVRVRGPVEVLTDDESDAYWAGRPPDSQVAAAVSAQSRPVATRADLHDLFASAREEAAGAGVARPGYWGGYRVVPHEIEFWQGRPARLHDRLLYVAHGDEWTCQRLQP